MSELNNVVVYCGSRLGTDPSYIDCAEALGKELLKNNIGLVYGSGQSGLMGKISQTVFEGGGKVVGITTEHLNSSNKGGYGDKIIVKTMHERKKLMFDKVDGFIALPGGFGTIEELLEVVTWYQLGLHNKPIGILNVNNYYDKFLEWINHAQSQGFIPSHMTYVVSHSEPAELIKIMQQKLNLSNAYVQQPWG